MDHHNSMKKVGKILFLLYRWKKKKVKKFVQCHKASLWYSWVLELNIFHIVPYYEERCLRAYA